MSKFQQSAHEVGMAHEQQISEQIIGWVVSSGIDVPSPQELSVKVSALIDTFGIEAGAIHDGRDKLLLAAIANELSPSLLGEDSDSDARVADMVALAFGAKSNLRDEVERTEYRPGYSEERALAAYETLINSERSRELETYIAQDESFVELRHRLGIDDESEQSFRVCVLNIGDDNAFDCWLPDIDWEGMRHEDASAILDRQKRQKDELRANLRYLNAESGYDENEVAPAAWVRYTKSGERLYCIPLPVAEKVLHPEGRSQRYDQDAWARAKSALFHEFTHTQKPVLRGHDVGLGISLEELRAEYFSGDKHGYTEVKRYFLAIKALFGYSPRESMESIGHFDPEEFEVDIARHLGLEGYLDAMTLIPSTYAQSSAASPFLRGLVAADGGVDGHYDRMYRRAEMQYGNDELSRRVALFVDSIVERHSRLENPVVSVEGLLSYQYPANFTKQTLADYRARYPTE